MTKDLLLSLILKRLDGQLSTEETLALDSWADESPANRAWLDRLSDDERLEKEIQQYKNIDPVGGYERWLGYMQARRKSKVRRIVGWSVAASILTAVGVAGLIRNNAKHDGVPPAVATTPAVIVPGRNTATLTLGNGQRLLLDSAGTGALAVQGGSKLIKLDSGSLSYAATGSGASATAVVYNTLVTPRAGQFKLILPDGTEVWLNNASSLRYPSSFTGATRTVELTGEAYFDVARNTTQPFQVKAGGLSVQVLGTGFNISAYPDEPDIRTTLIQGKIKVESKEKSTVLQPGQQVVATEDGGWKTLKSVNTQEVTDWRFGLFNFDNADLHSVLRQLARWYDVDVEFRGAVPDKRVQGQMHRDLTLNQVLEILRDKDIQFILQGRKLIVTP
jgi:ferric-dicitrate binding protein FerR (iron transport regulator)